MPAAHRGSLREVNSFTNGAMVLTAQGVIMNIQSVVLLTAYRMPKGV